MFTRVKTEPELRAMRESGRMLATVLQTLRARVEPGITTKALADLAAKELRGLGGEPPFLHYQGFPDVICISLNDEVVHGIPSAGRVVADGDIITLDFGVRYEGMITDSAVSLIAGTPKDRSHIALLEITERSLMAGMAAVRDGTRTGDIGAAVEAVLRPAGYGIVRDLVGHGVGDEVHEGPDVPNYGRKGTGDKLNSGMTIAIEPMATLGRHEVYMMPDGWTVRTRDHSLSAHFEHTVAVLADRAEIMTVA